MKSKSTKRFSKWKVLIFFLLTFWGVFSGTRPTSAYEAPPAPVAQLAVDPARQHMLDIAYLYAHHHWTATLNLQK